MAQFYLTGQDPGQIKWMQIKTPDFRLVYPEVYSSEAKRFAALLDTYRHLDQISLGHAPRSVPVLFHPYSILSNGFVVWAPKRAEIYPLPPQDIDAQDWLTQLAIHEYRHVVQLDKMNQGLTGVLRWITGQQAIGAASGLLPPWFLEGDAVHAETAFSPCGRGRLPSFDMEVRTLTLTRPDPYPFIKCLEGSYKDYVPDHYQYGYKMTAWLRYHYGTKMFDTTLNEVARKPFLLYPFYFSLRKQTGLSRTKIYKNSLEELRSEWASQEPLALFPDSRTLNRRKNKTYTTYQFPVYLNDSLVIAQKSGLDDAENYVLIEPSGKETRLLIPDNGDRVRLSSAKGQLVWAGEVPDCRWDNRSYSVIYRYDIKRKKLFTVSRKTRYFAPSLSADALRTVVVEVTPLNQVSLVILDTQRGSIVSQIVSPGNRMLIQPCWADSTHIAVIVQEEKGKSIREYDLASGLWTTVLSPTYSELSDLSAYGHWILFRAGFTGIGNLFALDRRDHSVWQVTSVRFGAYYPAVSQDGTKMVFSSYNADGFDVMQTTFDPSRWVAWNDSVSQGPEIYRVVTESEQEGTMPVKEMSGSYEETKYHKLFHLFNLHSYLPLYTDYDAMEAGDPVVHPGFTLLSQNLLGTSVATMGAAWIKGAPVWKGSWSYLGRYPAFDFHVTRGGEPLVYKSSGISDPSVQNDFFQWIGRVYLPLNFSTLGYIRYLMPSFESEYRNDWFYYPDDDRYRRGMDYCRARLVAYQYQQMAVRDIVPRNGQVIDLRYQFTPFDDGQIGAIWTTRTGVYLPGIGKHHSFVLGLSYQKQIMGNNRYFYSNAISLPRGYELDVNHKIFNLTKLSADYHLPLWYPDLHAGTMVYIKRFRADLFADYAATDTYIRENGTWGRGKDKITSIGSSFIVDFHLFQIMFPLSAGIQISYLTEQNAWKMFPVVSVDLSSF